MIPGGASRGRDELRQTEVENLQLVSLVEHYVRGLDVAVNDVAAMRFGQRVGQLERELQRLIEGKRPPADELLERLAVDVLHHEEHDVLGFVNFVDCADVRMIDSRCSASLPQEAHASLLVTYQLGGKRFDGDRAVKLCVFRFVDHTHTAFSNLFQYAVVEYGFSNHQLEPERDLDACVRLYTREDEGQ